MVNFTLYLNEKANSTTKSYNNCNLNDKKIEIGKPEDTFGGVKHKTNNGNKPEDTFGGVKH